MPAAKPLVAAGSASPALRIRTATPADAVAIAALSGQLGYPAQAVSVAQRLAVLGAQPDSAVVLIAESAAVAAGVAQVLLQCFVTEEPFAELAALVVDADARGTRVGTAPLAAAEAWVREHGVHVMYVRSNVVRTRAHRFYLREGYVERKRQTVFTKLL